MKRSALFTLVLLMCAALAFGQAVVTPSGQATTAGVAVPVVPYSPPLLVTPIVHLSTASTLPATNGGAVAAPEPPTAPGIRAEVQYGQPVVYLGTQQPAAESNTAPTTVAGQQPFDMGVTAIAGATAGTGAIAENDGLNGRSLGEVARELRGQMQNANAKVYTNSDVNSLPNAGGITGTTTAAQQQTPSNGSYPVGDNGVIRQNGPAVAAQQNPNGNAAPQQPATEQNQQAQPMNQPLPPASNQATPPQKPSAGTVPPQQTAEAQAPQNPADQNAAAGQAQSQQEAPQKTLPKSASLLPLIALVGAGATVAGLMARK